MKCKQEGGGGGITLFQGEERKEVTGNTISLPPTEVTPGQDFPNLVGQMI